MRKNVLAILFCIITLIGFNTNSSAQSTLIYYWNFNNFTSVIHWPAIASVGADYGAPGHDTSKARVVWTNQYPNVSSGYLAYADFVSGDPSDTVNARMGAVPGNGFRARNPSDSMELLFYMPSTHYGNLSVKFGCEASSFTSGMLQQLYSYSVDSGATWVTSGTGLSMWTDTTTLVYSLYNIHVNDTLANNNPKFVFRITFNLNTTGTSGNNRFDNITLEGDSSNVRTGVYQLTNEAPTYSLFPNPVTNQVDINANLDGSKTIEITNLAGQSVYSGKNEGRHISINTSGLNGGLYFISIRENNTGNVTTLQFVKQ